MFLIKVKILNQPFLYKDAYKANYILNKPTSISPSSSNSNNVRLFVAAKEVETIDAYALNENIEKLDLNRLGMVLFFY